MKKTSKKPRKFGRRKVKQNFRVRQESWNRKSRRLSDEMIDFIDNLSPGFEAWYRASYDDEGNFVGERIRGLFG